MPTIDLAALDQAATGNPKAKVTVNKRWLREVHHKLVAGERAESELARLKRQDDIFAGLFGVRRPF